MKKNTKLRTKRYVPKQIKHPKILGAYTGINQDQKNRMQISTWQVLEHLRFEPNRRWLEDAIQVYNMARAYVEIRKDLRTDAIPICFEGLLRALDRGERKGIYALDAQTLDAFREICELSDIMYETETSHEIRQSIALSQFRGGAIDKIKTGLLRR